MTYWRTSRALSGGQPVPGSPRALDTQRDLNSFPPADFSFPRSDLAQAVFDVLGALLLIGVTGAGIGFALFILIFVRLS